MDLKRRNFILRLIGAGAFAAVAACRLAGKASPRKFLRAVRMKKYPGLVGSLRKIGAQGKWNG